MTVYYQDESVTLHHGDWRELIPEGFTADLILTDPPYGETSLEWDRWPTGWPALAARHARSMWCFGSMRMFLARRADFTDWRLSQDVVWEKNNGPGFATDRFRRVHEFATHWYRGGWDDIYHETPREPRLGPEKRFRRRALDVQTYGQRGETYHETDGTQIVRSVIYAPVVRDVNINETEKPVPLLESLVSYGCPPAGTVLDLFAGSGSTLVAARNLGRKAIGYEVREEQCEATALRLSQGVLDFGAGA